MQTFLLSRFEPTLVHVAQLAAQAVVGGLSVMSDISIYGYIVMFNCFCHYRRNFIS